MIPLKATETIFPQARIGAGGVLMFPHRGDPPKAIQGYRKDPGDPYIFIPILMPCKYRTVGWRKICGGLVQCIHCTKFSIDVKTIDCMDCEDREI